MYGYVAAILSFNDSSKNSCPSWRRWLLSEAIVPFLFTFKSVKTAVCEVSIRDQHVVHKSLQPEIGTHMDMECATIETINSSITNRTRGEHSQCVKSRIDGVNLKAMTIHQFGDRKGGITQPYLSYTSFIGTLSAPKESVLVGHWR